jgi:parallel beta-helix repeat protein
MVFMSARLKRASAGLGATGVMLAGLTVLAAGPASAQTLACGTTITSSVTLTQNIDCSHTPGVNALTIDAAGVTVNLNGHRILGPGASGGSSGIISGYSGLTVENGSISNFTQDVQVAGGSGLVLRYLAITSSTGGYGVHAIGLSDASIHNLYVGDLGVGIWLDHSQDSTVSRNYLANPDTGLWDLDGTSNTWSDNALHNAANTGILAQSTTDAVIRSNTVARGADADGIDNEGATGSLITGNLLSDLHYGIFDQSSSNGTIADNEGFGDTQGISVTDSTDQVRDNLFI